MRKPSTNPNIVNLSGCFIAGGAILSIATKTEINDYDVYPKSKDGLENAIAMIYDAKCFLINISDRALTFKSNEDKNDNGERAIIQVMTYDFFPTAEKIFENFDFSICMGAYDCDSNDFIYHDDFFPDVASKTLRFNNKTLFPLNSFLRVSKYNMKGYYMSKPEQTKLALTVANAGLPESWEELESQIGGSYGREIELARTDIEYSYEAGIELLSNLVFDFSEYLKCETLDYSKFTIQDLHDILGLGDEKFYIKIKNNGMNNNPETVYIVSGDGLLQNELHYIVVKELGIPDHIKPYDGDTLFGFKTLLDDGEKLLPPLSNKNDITYAIGENTTFLPHPHLSIYTTEKDANNMNYYAKKLPKKIYLASFKIADIKIINGRTVQVSSMDIMNEVVSDK